MRGFATIEWSGYTEWPGVRRTDHETGRFKLTASLVVRELQREAARFDADHVRVLVDAPAHAFRRDGQLAAGKRVGYAGVLVQLRTRDHGMLSFPCDTYGDHWHNLRAVTLTLAALRDIERYGAAQGRQLSGFAALPGMGQSTATLGAEAAARELVRLAGRGDAAEILRSVDVARVAVLAARARTHPDRQGGDRRAWDNTETAARRIAAHHGVPL